MKPKCTVITGVTTHEVMPGERVYFHKYEVTSAMDGTITEKQHARSEAIDREAVKPFFVKRMPTPILRAPRPGDIPEVPEEYYIYAMPDVQEKLGLVYDAWNDMSVRINSDYDTIQRQRDMITEATKIMEDQEKWIDYYRKGNIFMRILKVIMK